MTDQEKQKYYGNEAFETIYEKTKKDYVPQQMSYTPLDEKTLADRIGAALRPVYEKAIAAIFRGNKHADAELDALTDAARKVIRSEEKALDETLREKLETTVTEASAAKFVVSEYPKTEAEVRAFVSIISDSDYSAEMTALRENTSALETSIKQYALVNAPSEAYVVKCLKKVKGVLGISAVTEDNDPNGKLNKAHCYIAAVYFSHKYVKQENVYGKTVIDKGTDGGGCVEVYTSEEDAIKRDEYLAAFDGTILVSGSHRVVGTVVVRTSNEMKASQQKKLEKAIIAELTRVG